MSGAPAGDPSGRPLRILLMSGTRNGGAARSTHALAAHLAARGHDVRGLFRTEQFPRADYLYKRTVNLYTKLAGLRGPASAVDLAARRLGARRRPGPSGLGYPVEWCAVPENGLRGFTRTWRPDVAVVCSIERIGWRRTRDALRASGIPSLLYMREAVAVTHLTVSNAPPDLLVSNAASHADRARELGYECLVIPSVVEPAQTAVASTRTTALLVNPIPSHGVRTVLELARRRPNIPFVLQRSWAIPPSELSALEERAAALGNVEIRPFTADGSSIYRDAKVLLVPHEIDNRPRVVAEAQANGIPVVAADQPGLREAVGPGGVLVACDAGPQEWVSALSSVWDDDDAYERAVADALAHAARPEMQPHAVVDAFEAALRSVVDGRGEPRAS